MQLVIFFTVEEEVPNHSCKNMGTHFMSNYEHSSSSIFFSCCLQTLHPLFCIHIIGERVKNELRTKIMLCCLCFC